MDLDKRAKAIKRLKEKTLCDFRFSKDFLERSQEALTTKEKVDKLDSIKNLNACLLKTTVKKMKVQVQIGRKYL